MTFDYFWLLALAIVAPFGVAWVLRRAERRREARFARLGDAPVVERLLPEGARTVVRGRAWRLAVAASLAGVGLAGPRWGSEETIVRTRGLDMVIALDASLSMLGTDDKPNRLTRMKQEVRRLRAMSGGDRVGLIAFAGRSYVLSPLTIDAGALDLFLDNLDPSVVGQAGSSLARAIRQGTDLLSLSRGGSDKALIVMSDGEAFEPVEDVTAEARRAAQAGVSVVMVGFGTEGGARIPLLRGEFKRDENGNVVITRYQAEFLRAAAEAANGTFIDAAASDKATRVRGALAALRRQQRTASAGETRIPRFQYFLLPALVLLGLDTWLTERVRRKKKLQAPSSKLQAPSFKLQAQSSKLEAQSLKPILSSVLLLLLGCAAQQGPAAAARAYHGQQFVRSAALYRAMVAGGDRSPPTLYNFGTALIAADSLRSAAEVLELAAESGDPELKYRALFNLGLSHLKLGLALPPQQANEPLDAALATYKKVLLMRSGDQDAKWNYELALRKKQQGGGGGGGSSGQSPNPSPESENPRPSGGLSERQAGELLGSAAREERDVQQKRQRQNRAEPPRGKDW